MPDFSVGASLLNLGKYYKPDEIGGPQSKDVTNWPSPVTLKAGANAVFYKNENFDVSAALDITVPTFQNVIFDITPKFCVKEMLYFTFKMIDKR